MKRLLAAAAAFGLAVLSSQASARAEAPPDPSALKASTPIQHLVVMTQSGHSFDNYFRWWPGADGAKHVACERATAATKCIAPFRLKPGIRQVPMRTSRRLQRVSVDGGRMDRFVRAQATRETSGYMAMGYYKSHDVPVLSELARRGVLFDHWFAGVPGGTIANRLFSVTGRASGSALKIPPHGWSARPTVFDRLQRAGVSWRIYVENYEPALTIETASNSQRLGGQLARVPVLAMRRYLREPAFMSHVVDLSQYYHDASLGQLPAVSYIVSTTQSEQAPQPPDKGQRLARSVANGLISSRSWAHSAFLLQYDSSGGFYDHVSPPRIAGDRLGLRVPAILMSPYAKAGTIDHSRFDAATVLRFIEDNWNVAPLSSRDRMAGDLRSALSVHPTTDGAELIPTSSEPPVSQPHRLPLYLGYAGALIVVIVLLWWTVSSERARGRTT